MTRRTVLREFWERFLIYKGLPEDLQWQRCFRYELERGASERQLSLTLIGKKQAMLRSLTACQLTGCAAPKLGDLAIVTDWEGAPRCVIQTTAVRMLLFRDITWDLAQLEGEGDTFLTWRQNRVASFNSEGKALGYSFSPDMTVLFERFKLIYEVDG